METEAVEADRLLSDFQRGPEIKPIIKDHNTSKTRLRNKAEIYGDTNSTVQPRNITVNCEAWKRKLGFSVDIKSFMSLPGSKKENISSPSSP